MPFWIHFLFYFLPARWCSATTTAAAAHFGQCRRYDNVVGTSVLFNVVIGVKRLQSTPAAEKKKKKKMPKPVKSGKEWELRVRQFAGEVGFGKGQRPAKNTKWGQVVADVEKCPLHGRDPSAPFFLGRVSHCSCGYHVSCCVLGLPSSQIIIRFFTPCSSLPSVRSGGWRWQQQRQRQQQ